MTSGLNASTARHSLLSHHRLFQEVLNPQQQVWITYKIKYCESKQPIHGITNNTDLK